MTAGERIFVDQNDDRAHMIRPKYQLTTDASETPQNIGPDVAAELERSKEQLLDFGRYQPHESHCQRTARVQPNEQS